MNLLAEGLRVLMITLYMLGMINLKEVNKPRNKTWIYEFKPLVMTKAKLADPERGWYAIKCPACQQPHLYAVNTPFSNGCTWSFNDDLVSPTFLPSMNITWHFDNKTQVCHFYVRNGKIEYQRDCTHSFAGLTLDLPTYDDDEREE